LRFGEARAFRAIVAIGVPKECVLGHTGPAIAGAVCPIFQLQEQAMTTDVADAAKTLVQVTQAARVFDRLVETLLSQARSSQVASGSREVTLGHDGTLDIVDAELVAVRERMDALYPEFQRLYGDLLVQYVGTEHVNEVLQALCSEPIQRYFRARRQMEQALVEGMNTLTLKLTDVMYQSQAA
jgi:hypothetical protein